MDILRIIIALFTVYGLVRLCVYMVASNIYTVRQHFTQLRHKGTYYRPTVTLIVPAHNEESVITRTLDYIQRSDYPPKKLQVIVANDGSRDDTAKIVRSYARQSGLKFKVKLVSRPNHGKAEALNYAIKHFAIGSLVMCLDADSIIDKNCIKNIVQYFKDKRVVAAASNVNIIENGTLLSLAQRVEYLLSHELKKANTTFNMEYIIGGVGSVFRRSMLKQVSYYDSNTMTEDIDLTMKIVGQGNAKHKIVFASNALTYTEPVQTYKALIMQRFRWKYGRLQTFLKNKQLFFNTDPAYTKQLTFFLLPTTVFYEALLLIELLIVCFILFLVITQYDMSTVFSIMFLYSIILLFIVWSIEHISVKERLRLSFYAPAAYLLIYMLVFVEYAAAAKSAYKLPGIKNSLRAKKTTWRSPERNAQTAIRM